MALTLFAPTPAQGHKLGFWYGFVLEKISACTLESTLGHLIYEHVAARAGDETHSSVTVAVYKLANHSPPVEANSRAQFGHK